MRTSPSVPGLGTNPCLGKHFRQRVTASVKCKDHFSLEPTWPTKKRRHSLTADVLEAGNYYQYYARGVDGAIENDAAIGCVKLFLRFLSRCSLNVSMGSIWNYSAEPFRDPRTRAGAAG